MKGSYSAEDVQVFVCGEECSPVEVADWADSAPAIPFATFTISNEEGSVKIPLSQRVYKELKEKGFLK